MDDLSNFECYDNLIINPLKMLAGMQTSSHGNLNILVGMIIRPLSFALHGIIRINGKSFVKF